MGLDSRQVDAVPVMFHANATLLQGAQNWNSLSCWRERGHTAIHALAPKLVLVTFSMVLLSLTFNTFIIFRNFSKCGPKTLLYFVSVYFTKPRHVMGVSVFVVDTVYELLFI